MKRYGEWLLGASSRFLLGCNCKPEPPCGCVDAEQRYWCLDMDRSAVVDYFDYFEDTEINGGCECLQCGATWTDTEMKPLQ